MCEALLMRKKILMVYPEIPDTYWSFSYALPFTGKKSLMPPLGLITVAALLPEHYSITLVDMNIESLTEKAAWEADMVFISAMIVQKESFEKNIDIKGFTEPYNALFIRAPVIEKVWGNCETLAEVDKKIVMAKENNLLALSFHPELTDDLRIHKYFLDMILEYKKIRRLQNETFTI